MVHLQMALHPHVDVMPSYKMIGTSKFPSLRHERVCEPQSRLELMKNEYQQRLLRQRGEKLVDPFPQQQLTALNKARISLHHLSLHTTMQSDSLEKGPQAPFRKGFSSAGSHSRNTRPDYSQAHMWPSNCMAKRSAGVDRAYPLRPVFHRKTVSLNNNIQVEEPKNTLLLHSPPTTSSCTPIFNSRKLPTTKEQATDTPTPSRGPGGIQQRSMSNPGRLESCQIQELEAMGESLELEIQRKEALLRQKLRRTEKELRRIQREKEQVEKEERNERERQEKGKGLDNGRVAMSPRKAVGTAVTKDFRNVCKVPLGSNNEEEVNEADIGITRSGLSARNHKAWANPAVHHISYRPNPLGRPQEYTVVKLKKERLVASNSKMQAQETLAPSEIARHQLDPQFEANCSNFRPFSRSHSNYSLEEMSDQVKPSDLNLEDPCAGISSEVGEENGYPENSTATDLVPCQICGRTFLLERLQKHVAVCKKMKNSKRKVFDSSKARTKGTDLEPYLYLRSRATSAMPEIHAKKSTWRPEA
ncbi:zinc finger C2HC domain-containing protein 1C isoform X2 [Rhinatrema bivittatum]|uniref:zinc finger C2HC domain-containing protein 1C isoform X2 n=1 Tax=Rhinatrema bivittatum TaxID=194408 RepID=UPI00112C6728|nr:zinc finger C2HC domain-containing protein 1C isoform X2 [Rhinatrema bivittatum]